MVYRKIKKNEIKEASKLVADSFWDYPLFDGIIPDKKKRLDFLRDIHELNIKVYARKHCCFVGILDGRIACVASLRLPGKKEAGLMDYIMAGGIKVLRHINVREIFHFLTLLEEAGKACDTLTEHTWYVESLAVAPFCQGQQIGSKMLNHCIKPYVSKNGGGKLTLITNTDRNRKFYKKNGFKEFDGRQLDYNGFKFGNWSFELLVPAS